MVNLMPLEKEPGTKAHALAKFIIDTCLEKEFWPHARFVVERVDALTPSRHSEIGEGLFKHVHAHADRGTVGGGPVGRTVRSYLMDACVLASHQFFWPPSATWSAMQLCDRLIYVAANVNLYDAFCGDLTSRSTPLRRIEAHAAYELFFTALTTGSANHNECSVTKLHARSTLAFLLVRAANGVVGAMGQEGTYACELTLQRISDRMEKETSLRTSVGTLSCLWRIVTLGLLDGQLLTQNPMEHLQVALGTPLMETQTPPVSHVSPTTKHAWTKRGCIGPLVCVGRCPGYFRQTRTSVGNYPNEPDIVPCQHCCLCLFQPPIVHLTPLVRAAVFASATPTCTVADSLESLYARLLRPTLMPLFKETQQPTQDDLTVTARMSVFCLLSAFVGVDGDAPMCDVAIVAMIVEMRIWRRSRWANTQIPAEDQTAVEGLLRLHSTLDVTSEAAFLSRTLEETEGLWSKWRDLQTERESGELTMQPSRLPVLKSTMRDWRTRWILNVARDVEGLFLESLDRPCDKTYQVMASVYGTQNLPHKSKYRNELFTIVWDASLADPSLKCFMSSPRSILEDQPQFRTLGVDMHSKTARCVQEMEVVEKLDANSAWHSDCATVKRIKRGHSSGDLEALAFTRAIGQ
jgi:hypothetical protein